MLFLHTAIAALAALAAATPVAVAPIEARDEKPNPNEVFIASASWAGTGCPPGSVSADLGEAATLLSLSFSKYVAKTGKNTQPGDERRNCNVRVKLHYPQGFTYTLSTTDYRGHAKIPAKCKGTLSANYFFSGQQQTATAKHDFWPVQDKDFLVTTDVAVASLVWSKCGVTGGPLFNINSVVQLQCKKDQDAYLELDTQDTKFNMKFHIQWKKC
jgi:hypothetical protein